MSKHTSFNEFYCNLLLEKDADVDFLKSDKVKKLLEKTWNGAIDCITNAIERSINILEKLV